MKEIAFFVDTGREYQVSNVIKILSLNKARIIKIINREKWQGYNFKNCAIVVITESIDAEIAIAMQRTKEAGVPSLIIQGRILLLKIWLAKYLIFTHGNIKKRNCLKNALDYLCGQFHSGLYSLLSYLHLMLLL